MLEKKATHAKPQSLTTTASTASIDGPGDRAILAAVCSAGISRMQTAAPARKDGVCDQRRGSSADADGGAKRQHALSVSVLFISL